MKKNDIKGIDIIIITMLSQLLNHLSNEWIGIPQDLKLKKFYPDMILFLISLIKLIIIFVLIYYIYLKFKNNRRSH